MSTFAKYSTGPEGARIYTTERAMLHDSLLNYVFNKEAVEAATPAPGETPTLTLMGGRGGSGKTWFSESPDSPMVKGSLVINSDFFKELLPEYKGWNAYIVHEESADLANRALEIARLAGLNVAYDATMRSPGTFERMIPAFKSAGYKVDAFFMHTAPQISAVRALGRWKSGGGVRGGRYVPPEYILGSRSNEDTFDSIKWRANRWAIFNNNGPKSMGPQYAGGHLG